MLPGCRDHLHCSGFVSCAGVDHSSVEGATLFLGPGRERNVIVRDAKHARGTSRSPRRACVAPGPGRVGRWGLCCRCPRSSFKSKQAYYSDERHAHASWRLCRTPSRGWVRLYPPIILCRGVPLIPVCMCDCHERQNHGRANAKHARLSRTDGNGDGADARSGCNDAMPPAPPASAAGAGAFALMTPTCASCNVSDTSARSEDAAQGHAAERTLRLPLVATAPPALGSSRRSTLIAGAGANAGAGAISSPVRIWSSCTGQRWRVTCRRRSSVQEDAPYGSEFSPSAPP